jgi:CheY-like chemotaxis protein
MAKILIIDDEESVRLAVNAVLTSRGHEVTHTDNGVKALEIVKKNIPDLIVCDIEMPDLKGFDVLKELRKDNVTSKIPFIFLTGKSDISYLNEAIALDVDDYLRKPFTAEELHAAIDVQLKKKK